MRRRAQRPYRDGVETTDPTLLWVPGGRPPPLPGRAVLVAVPVVLAAVVVAVHPSLHTGIAELVALIPWALMFSDHCPRRPYWLAALPIGAVAFLMADWKRTDLCLMLLVLVVAQWAINYPKAISLVTYACCLAVPVSWSLFGDYAQHSAAWVLGISLAYGSGLVLRSQQLALVRLAEAQQDLAAKAVVDERRRIAREVHDLAAHSMAVTMLHLTGARLALADGEIAEADAALASAERLGRTSLDEIRRAVGVLTDPDEASARAPEPGARDIKSLIVDYKRAGMALDVTVEGRPSSDVSIIGLTMYRLIQESLANAARHAPAARVSLSITWAADSVSIVVRNPVSGVVPAGRGHGLAGMRERVETLGGSLQTGRVDDEWQVRATLPCAVPVADAR
jgi:signal transduction histidine kinase